MSNNLLLLAEAAASGAVNVINRLFYYEVNFIVPIFILVRIYLTDTVIK